MSVRLSIALLILVSPLTASYRVSYEDKNVYDSLDRLAEIMTLAQANSPEKVESKVLVEGAIGGLLEQLDPHTSYYNHDRYTTMQEDQHGSFFGIGIIVGTQNDKLTIISPVSGAPAAMAGMRAGDVIVKIGTVESSKMASYDAIRLLRGSEGTTVDIEVLRSGVDEPINFTLTRAAIPSLAVRTSFMADDTTGYVALKEFAETATDEVAAALEKLTDLGMKQVILDLRGNPGGLLPQAISIASLFLESQKLVVSTKGRLKSSNQEFFTQAHKTYEDLPLLVLIDRGSASASEIVAGAIQDHDRGLILGISSWGKGLVQSVFPLGDGDTGLALTTARYYTPSGRNIQGDYSSLEDYYNPKSARDIFFGTGEQEVTSPYKTTHGRTVMQTRGVTPDVFLSSPDEPEDVTELEGLHNAFFNFVTTWSARPESITRDFVASDEVVESFQVWLQEKKIEVGDLKPYKEILRQKLTYQTLYTATSKDSEAMAWRYRMTQDRHVHAAIELIPRASELLSVYKGESNMRPEYNSELRAFSKERDITPQSAALIINRATKN